MTDHEIQAALAEPFPYESLGWKPQAVKGDKAMVIAYIDARDVQERLDQVVGVSGWETSYEPLGDSMLCKLRVKIGEVWVTKMDVGSPSEQPDAGDRIKASVSDALKRAAVNFGIGRYLYSFPTNWCDYDPQRKKILKYPTLPEKFLPKVAAPVKQVAQQPQAVPQMPKDGVELLDRLHMLESNLVAKNICSFNELIRAVQEAGVKMGNPTEISRWGSDGIALAVKIANDFRARKPKALNVN